MTVLVLDIGSSSIRALLFDDRARLIPGAVVVIPHAITTEPSGAATLDVRETQERVETAIDQILQHPAAPGIQAVGMATLVGNVLGVDRHGLPLTPIFTYADTRSAEDVALLRAQIDAGAVHQRTGCVLHSAYLPARLHWLRRTQPETVRQVACWLDLATYLYRQWLGDAPCSFSVASWSGLLHRETLVWDGEWLETLGLSPDRLPALADYDAVQVGLTGAYAARWPLLRDVPFCLAVGDGVAANVGAGCVSPSRIALTVGTTAALRTITDKPVAHIPPGLWCYRVNARLSLVGGATSEGGNIFQWARNTLRLEDDPAVERALESRAPDSHGLTMLPLLAGERSPGWAADATGAMIGLRLSTTPLDILQASLEAVALRLALIAEQVALIADADADVVATGGALDASPAWVRMLADALNRPLTILAETEVTARGVAVLALAAIGVSSLSDLPPTTADIVMPNPERAAILLAARERQVRLYNKIITSDDASE